MIVATNILLLISSVFAVICLANIVYSIVRFNHRKTPKYSKENEYKDINGNTDQS